MLIETNFVNVALKYSHAELDVGDEKHFGHDSRKVSKACAVVSQKTGC